MLYLVTSNTGLRNQELASLTPDSFKLSGTDPSVTVQASYSKHRRQDVQQIRADLADLLRDYLAGKPAGEPVWPGRWWYKAAKMMRADLKDARRAWIKEAGEDAQERQRREESDYLTYKNAAGEVFDFYAQRGQMLTALEQAGVSLKTLQTLARHSRVETTLKHYTRKPRLADTRAALDSLPALPTNALTERKQILAATGTDGAPGPRLDQTADVRCLAMRPDETVTVPVVPTDDCRNPLVLIGVESVCEPVREGERKRPLPDSNRGWRICNPLP
jgi:hypothetical protein